MLTTLQTFSRSLVSLVAPPRCVRCLVVDTWLCPSCRSDILQSDYRPTCLGCRTLTTRGVTCKECSPTLPLYGVVSGGRYHVPWVKRSVDWLKFRNIHALAPAMAELLLPRLFLIGPPEQLRHESVLVPLPLHARRLRERGYNQALLIAQALSSLTSIPISLALERHRATARQARLPKDLRESNVADAFRLRETTPVHKHILLVDDVVTTGVTLSSAAAALSPNVTQQIWGVTFARG